MPEAHSAWPASSFHRTAQCPGSLALAQLQPPARRSSFYSAEGTVAHGLLEMELHQPGSTADRLNTIMKQDGFDILIDADMLGHVTYTVGKVRELAGHNGVVCAEKRVHYHAYLDLPKGEAWGTSDVTIVKPPELMVVDLKYGQGVRVDAENNEQLMLYALGCLEEYGDLGDFETVRLVIIQPRLEHVSEWTIEVGDLEQWAYTKGRQTVRSVLTAKQTFRSLEDSEWVSTFLHPSEDACRFCPFASTCPALRGDVAQAVQSLPASADEFEDVAQALTEGAPPADDPAAQLDNAMQYADRVEAWCKAVRADAQAHLMDGGLLAHFKLVQGKRGNRQWEDPKAAEETLKAMRLKDSEVYDWKLINPAGAEKLHKLGRLGKRQFIKLSKIWVQQDGKPHVAPSSDPRPAISMKPVADDFDTESFDDLA